MAATGMNLASLKKSKAARKTALNKLFAKLRADIDKKDTFAVNVGLNQLQAKELEIITILMQLEALTDPDDLEEELEDQDTIKNAIILEKLNANQFLATNLPASTSIQGSLTSSSNSGYRNSKNPNSTKLPKLEIKKFLGSVQDWQRFSDQFTSGVDNNSSLSDSEKLNYLFNFVGAEAEKSIKGLQLSDRNYAIAWGILKERFGRKEVIVEEHIFNLMHINRVTMTRSGADLRRFLEEFKTHLRSLEALGSDVAAMGSILCPAILRSIPSSIVTIWNRLPYSRGNTNLSTLLTFVQTELENIEEVYRLSAAESHVKDNKMAPLRRQDGGREDRGPQYTSSSLVSAQVNRTGTGKKSAYCLFCEKDSHYTSSCTQSVSNADRRKALRQNRRCFNCFSKNHISTRCPNNIVCRACQQSHHTLTCPSRENSSQPHYRNRSDEVANPRTKPIENVKSPVTSASCHTTENKTNKQSVLQSTRVWINYPGGKEQITLLVDGGSEKSFIKEDLVHRLGLQANQEEKLTVHAFGGGKSTQRSFSVPIVLAGNSGIEVQLQVMQVKDICSGITMWDSEKIDQFLSTRRERNWSELMGRGETVAVDILIGADWYWRIMTGHMKRITPYLMATESVFGWVLLGSTGISKAARSTVAMFTSVEIPHLEELNKKIGALWELDKQGTYGSEDKQLETLEDVETLRQFEKTTVFEEGRYTVRIPWNEEKENLCNNYGLAKERLRRLIFKLQKNPVLLDRYRTGVYEYLKNGHIEETQPEVNGNNPLYHMPHQAVIKEDRKTTKLRIVFDASSHSENGKSLNECQFAGTNLNPRIFDLLLRFRIHKIAISSDAEKAFLQVVLHPNDREATRFLWTDENWEGNETPKLKIFQFKRVPFGMKSSPFLLAATIRHHVNTYQPRDETIARVVDKNTYVDDLLCGARTTEEGWDLSVKIKELMEKGGLLFKKWATNNENLRAKWMKHGMIGSDEPIELLKVLGLMWDPKSDNLSLKHTNVVEAITDSKETKRGILELMARIFDPLGFLTPTITTAKYLLQEVWRDGTRWDEEITENNQAIWKNWKSELRFLKDVCVPRWYGTLKLNEATLHLFCDASGKAYGSVAYLVAENEDGKKESKLVAAKGRINPLKVMSIPRLELMACLIAARLAQTIREAWNEPNLRTVLWSDSRVALEWIQGRPSKWKLFVGKRVQEIQELTRLNEWHHCYTKDNIADIISRGQKLSNLLKNQEWWKGPSWILENEERWKKSCGNEKAEEKEVMEEMQVASLITTHEKPVKFLNEERISTWKKAKRVLAWVLRFIKNVKKTENKRQATLTLAEIQNAEKLLMKQAQQEVFFEEIQALTKGNEINRKSRLLKFNAFMDEEGLLRMGGRLKYANLDEGIKHPILLGDCELAKMYVMDQHFRTKHGGVQEVMIAMRREVWMLRGRQMARKGIASCVACRKWNAKPVEVREAPLPAARVNKSEPFAVTGLDFAGPLWVKDNGVASKSYICLFTCGVTRAVHLELVPSQNRRSFILAFRRFVARRGTCRIIYSDNANTFHETDHMLREVWSDLRSQEVQNEATDMQIEWRFIAPQASWWGGFYERIVGSIKRHLRRSLGSASLGSEELGTLLTEIEAVINSRPLVAISEDAEDTEYITPSHFLLGKSSRSLQETFPSITSVPTQKELQKRWMFRRTVMDSFWKKWKEEYLLQLRTAHQVRQPSVERMLQLNDVVLLKDERVPRGQWRIARITECTAGRDGKMRSAMVQLSNGNIVRRPVQRICPLEIAT